MKAKRKGTLAPDAPKTKAEIKAQAREEALELLRRIGLEDKADVYPSTLSGGQKQRVAIVRALAMKPDVILFDEPTIGLHPLDVQTLLGVFQALVDNGATVLVIEHDLDVIRNADYIIDMGPGGGKGSGTLVASGSVCNGGASGSTTIDSSIQLPRGIARTA